MKPPKCRLCEKEHWSHQPHVFASNAASNIEEASNNASNTVVSAKVRGLSIPGHIPAPAVQSRSNGSSDVPRTGLEQTKQRWSRTACNAYQREYMRKRRAQV